MQCLKLSATDCPVFEVKAKINVSVLSDVINRPKSKDFNIKRSLLLLLSVARTRFDDSTKNHSSNTCISLLKICNNCIFHGDRRLSRALKYAF